MKRLNIYCQEVKNVHFPIERIMKYGFIHVFFNRIVSVIFPPSSNLTANKTYYVSVLGLSHAESSYNAVTLTVTPRLTLSMIIVTKQ